jgi:hypothetical protein
MDDLDPNLLSDVLAKSATELTDDEILILVKTLRNERAIMLAAEVANKAKPKSATKAAVDKAAASKLTFEDLGL